MTREEAIAILEVSKHMATSGRLYNQAIDMAIEALSEETIEIKPIEIKGDFHIDDDYKKPPQIIGNVEVVARCKDCKNWRESHSEDEESYCYIDGRTTDSTDYCSWGERREP